MYNLIIVTAQAEAFAVENSAKKVCMWGARPICTPFFAESLAQAEQLIIITKLPPGTVTSWIIFRLKT
jgi:hypothetical protein